MLLQKIQSGKESSVRGKMSTKDISSETAQPEKNIPDKIAVEHNASAFENNVKEVKSPNCDGIDPSNPFAAISKKKEEEVDVCIVDNNMVGSDHKKSPR